MSSGASLSLPDGLFAPHEVVRELGARPNPVYAVRQSGSGTGGKTVLAVAERFADATRVGAGGEDLASDARRIATLASPNLARTREVVVRGSDLVVIGEFVEGEKLQELWGAEKLPLEIALRIIVDALTGVGALHNLRDAKQQPMKLAHGELSPANVVLGLDGIGRVLHAVARRAAGVEPDPASLRYVAPEVASGEAFDARADVFSAGVMLWEALSEKPLFPEPDPEANARRVRSGPLPVATVSDKVPWARGLAAVAAKALSADADARWPTAAVMAAELRKAAGLKLAPASTAAAFAKSAFGERVKARRESLDGGSSSGRTPAPAPVRTAAPAPPRAPPIPPEPSFLEVDLESAIDIVQVAPGVTAPVAEVIELDSELLLESVSNSSIPPAAWPPSAGFVRDPFANAAALAPPPAPREAMRVTPPPAPAVAVAPVVLLAPPAPVEEPAPPSITGAPHFAAAIAAPAQSPPVAAPVAYAPAHFPPVVPHEPLAEEAPAEPRAVGRRKLFVLGGVGLLGLVIFLLAAIRFAQRDPDATPTSVSPPPPASTVVEPPPPAISAASLAPTVLPTPPPPASVAVAPPPPAQTTASRAPPPMAKPPPVAAVVTPVIPPAARVPAATKPRPKPKFDPNTL